MDASQRLFTVTTTVIVMCAVNIMFHRPNDNTKEVCETSEELGRRCTDDLDSRGRCVCAVYACDSPGCNSCVACNTIASCDASCDEVQPSEQAVILSSFIVTPVVFCLNKAFEWWHSPVADAVSNMVVPSAATSRGRISVLQLPNAGQCTDGTSRLQTADKQDESNSADDIGDRAVAERRTAFAAIIPYGLAMAIAIGSIVVIASISRPMSGQSTWEWILSVTFSLAVKWIIIDPVKVIVLTPVLSLAQRHQWNQRVMKFLSAVCLGTTDPHLRGHLHHAFELQRSLKRARLRLMQERVDAVRERDTAALSRAHEERVSMTTSDDVRKWLKAKHQKQQQEMLDRLAAVDRQLEQMVEGEQDAYGCVANVVENHSPDIIAARKLAQDLEQECQQAMATVRQDQQAATEVRVHSVRFSV